MVGHKLEEIGYATPYITRGACPKVKMPISCCPRRTAEIGARQDSCTIHQPAQCRFGSSVPLIVIAATSCCLGCHKPQASGESDTVRVRPGEVGDRLGGRLPQRVILLAVAVEGPLAVFAGKASGCRLNAAAHATQCSADFAPAKGAVPLPAMGAQIRSGETWSSVPVCEEASERRALLCSGSRQLCDAPGLDSH